MLPILETRAQLTNWAEESFDLLSGDRIFTKVEGAFSSVAFPFHIQSFPQKMQDTAEIKSVVPPKVQRGFETTRRKIAEALSQFTFVRVTLVSFPPCALRTGTHFQGEAVEVFPGKHHRGAPRTAFFSRFARGHGMNLLGCVQLVDAPLGVAHSSAVPQVGDILIGSLVEAKKAAKIPWELRGWSNHGKPLLELARIVQFGSRMSEKEIAQLLKQPGSSAAAFFLRLNASLPPQAAEKTCAQQSIQYADDVWALARVVCFGHLQDDSSLKTSINFVSLVDTLAMRFGDESLVEEWSKVRPEQYSPEHSVAASSVYTQQVFQQIPQPQHPNPWGPVPMQATTPAAGPAWSLAAPVPVWAAAPTQVSAAPGVVYHWKPPVADPSGKEASAFQPTSPVYHPTSPVYKPTSPVYGATSPVYRPSSPAYNPTSPVPAAQPQDVATTHPPKSPELDE